MNFTLKKKCATNLLIKPVALKLFLNRTSKLEQKLYFRKNPVHFKDYCHPGDESYEASDEDKGSNQYGSDSYR